MSKKALVTGASKGIGKSIAKNLVKCGYKVYICARDEDALKQTCEEIGAKDYIKCDLRDYNQIKSMVEKIGSVDILINNAGAYLWSEIEHTKEDEIDSLILLNIKSVYALSSLCVPHMKAQKWGRIVNIGSISGVVGEANASLYSMTKSALNGFSKALGLELAEFGITVNTINPGWVETELAQDAVNGSDFSQDEIIDMIPQRRFIEPFEIAGLVRYLVSDEAKGMTAQNISLCAGLSAG